MGNIIVKFSDFWKDSEDKFKLLIKGKKEDFKTFIIKFKKELNNTSEAKDILIRYAKGEKISKKEQVFFKEQVIEVIKGLGIGIPVILLPGGVLLLSFIIWLADYFNINILPSYLKKEKGEN